MKLPSLMEISIVTTNDSEIDVRGFTEAIVCLLLLNKSYHTELNLNYSTKIEPDINLSTLHPNWNKFPYRFSSPPILSFCCMIVTSSTLVAWPGLKIHVVYI